MMEDPDFDELIDDYIEDSFEEPDPQDEYDESFLEEMIGQHPSSQSQVPSQQQQNVVVNAAISSTVHSNARISDGVQQTGNDAITGDDGVNVHNNNESGATTSEVRTNREVTTTATTGTNYENDRASNANAIRAEFRESSDPDDLFAFERYKSDITWRSDEDTGNGAEIRDKGATGSPRTMRATGWKASSASSPSKHPASGSSLATSLTTTAAAAKTTHHGWLKKKNAINTKLAPESQLLAFRQNNYQNEQHYCSRSFELPKRRILTKLSANPIRGRDSVPFTLGDGTQLYVTVRNNEIVNGAQSSNGGNSRSKCVAYASNGSMLGLSMDALLRRVGVNRLKKEYENQTTVSPKSVDLSSNGSGAVADCSLWVDKHAPSSFSHLLSDERTNRQVVRALREWDPYVFHRDPPGVPAYQQQQKQQQNEGGWKHNRQDNNKEKNPRDKRPDPEKRVILLSGPPGVGKTSLAHIIAKHVGYRPVEINGSDERSAPVLTDLVLRAMESQTLPVMAKGKVNADGMAGSRPNCLILDEIDGADASSAIQALVDIIRADMPTSSKGSSNGKAAKKKSSPYLRRPIIFICNNKYAPALRPLLPYARHFQVSPPSPSRLVTRLLSVLHSEGLSLSGGSSLLHSLVALSGGDIRSCLHTLQFVAARAKSSSPKNTNTETHRNKKVLFDMTAALNGVLKGDGGAKDQRNDVSETVTTVFRKQKNNNIQFKGDVDRILHSVQSFGDNSKILDLIFLNVNTVSYIDPTMDRCSAAHEWLSSSDIYRSHKTSVASTDSSALYAMEVMHIPPAAGALHLLCRVDQRPGLNYTTRELFDARYSYEANQALVLKFLEGLSPKVRSCTNRDEIAIETVPYALWVLSAGQGSASLERGASSYELLSKGSAVAFDNHVAALVSLGLTYVASQDNESHPRSGPHSYMNDTSLRLEPPIDRLNHFIDLKLSSFLVRREIPQNLKELLATKVSYVKMNGTLKTSAKEKSSTPGNQSRKTFPTNLSLPAHSIKSVKECVIKHKLEEMTHSAKRMKPDVTAHNFLGIGAMKAKQARCARNAARVGDQRSKKNIVSHTGSGVALAKVARLKFVKGATEAVRTPCRLSDIAL